MGKFTIPEVTGIPLSDFAEEIQRVAYKFYRHLALKSLILNPPRDMRAVGLCETELRHMLATWDAPVKHKGRSQADTGGPLTEAVDQLKTSWENWQKFNRAQLVPRKYPTGSHLESVARYAAKIQVRLEEQAKLREIVVEFDEKKAEPIKGLREEQRRRKAGISYKGPDGKGGFRPCLIDGWEIAWRTEADGSEVGYLPEKDGQTVAEDLAEIRRYHAERRERQARETAEARRRQREELEGR